MAAGYILKFKGNRPDAAVKVIKAILGIEDDEAAKVNDQANGLVMDQDNANLIISEFGASDDGMNDDNLWTLKKVSGGGGGRP